VRTAMMFRQQPLPHLSGTRAGRGLPSHRRGQQHSACISWRKDEIGGWPSPKRYPREA